jgi:hypothetical protein
VFNPFAEMSFDRLACEFNEIGSLYGWRDKMQFRAFLGMAAVLSVTFSVGCSMTNPTVRGQGPDNSGAVNNGPVNNGPVIGSAPGYGDFKRAPYMANHGQRDFTMLGLRDNNFGYEGGYYAGPSGYYTNRTQPGAAPGGSCDCQECNNGQQCPQGGCRRCGRGCFGHGPFPHHYQTYQYNWPRNQVYPTQGVPAGVIQYPYYTLRGPTDFFMEKSL